MRLKSIILSVLLSASLPAAAVDIVTTPPEGEVVEYYADFQNFDNTFGFMGDYHTVQRLVFADDGSVYIPNLLLRNTMPAYVRGTYDKAAATVTVPAGQMVFYFPNEKIPVALYALDAQGNAGATASSFYDAPLVFDVAGDGTLSLRSSEEFPMFGLCNANASDEVYQNAKDLVFTPVKSVAGVTKHFKYTYTIEGDRVETTASAYRASADVVWVKGLDPKFPESWIRVERRGGTFVAPSFQSVFYFSSEDPIVFAAIQGANVMTALPVALDEETLALTAATDGFAAANISPDNMGGFDVFQSYTDLRLTPATFRAATPAAPSFVGYSEPNSSNETEFVFIARPVDTDGNMLLRDKLAFRMYVDGEPYVFTPADYCWIDADMALVPYGFDNYNFFSQGGADKERRYVYFSNLPAGVRTLGVEVVYTEDGAEHTSARLTYDIASGQASLTGIRGVSAAAGGAPVYYDLQGRPVARPASGLYIRRDGSGSRKVLVPAR